MHFFIYLNIKFPIVIFLEVALMDFAFIYLSYYILKYKIFYFSLKCFQL